MSDEGRRGKSIVREGGKMRVRRRGVGVGGETSE